MTLFYLVLLLSGLVFHQATTENLPSPEWFQQRLFYEFSDNNETISVQGIEDKFFLNKSFRFE